LKEEEGVGSGKVVVEEPKVLHNENKDPYHE
jgi:hypothetical protein